MSPLRMLAAFSILALAGGWAGWLVDGLSGSPGRAIFLLSPALAGVVMSLAVPALRAHWRRALWPTSLWSLWWLALPALALLLGGEGASGIAATFYGGPLGEEPGWRVIGQPLAVAALGASRGLLALGVIWGLWHAPLFAVGFEAGLYDAGLLGLALYLALCPVLSVLLYAVHRRSGGSLWACIGAHACFNTANQGAVQGITVGIGVLLLLLVAHRQQPWRSTDLGIFESAGQTPEPPLR